MATIIRRTALITGCSDGSLGSALALEFAKHDFHVYATLRNPEKAASLASHSAIEILPLDVTNSSSISSCAATIEKKAGGRLDVLVNNAGMMFCMPLLDTSIEESKKLFDVNVWGLLAVTQAFAPMLVRSKGVVLNIASIAGAVRMAWQGPLFPHPPFCALSPHIRIFRPWVCFPIAPTHSTCATVREYETQIEDLQASTTPLKPQPVGCRRPYASKCRGLAYEW